MACYDHGVLSKSLLSALMKPYKDVDIDSGGMAGTLSKKDKLDVVEVTIKVWGGKVRERPKLPKDYRKWTPERDKANEDWQEAKWTAFNKITDKFGWS